MSHFWSGVLSGCPLLPPLADAGIGIHAIAFRQPLQNESASVGGFVASL
jgi:hypothetical protein